MAMVFRGVRADVSLPCRRFGVASGTITWPAQAKSMLLCLGLGYCAEHYVARHGARFARVVGTTRTAERAAALAAGDFGGCTVAVELFDVTSASEALRAA